MVAIKSLHSLKWSEKYQEFIDKLRKDHPRYKNFKISLDRLAFLKMGINQFDDRLQLGCNFESDNKLW